MGVCVVTGTLVCDIRDGKIIDGDFSFVEIHIVWPDVARINSDGCRNSFKYGTRFIQRSDAVIYISSRSEIVFEFILWNGRIRKLTISRRAKLDFFVLI